MPKNENAGTEHFQILSQQPKIRVEWQNNMAQFFYVWILRKYGRNNNMPVFNEGVIVTTA